MRLIFWSRELGRILAILLVLGHLMWWPQRLPADTASLKELGEAHVQLMEDPGNLDYLYAYAQQAIRLGNYEAAIGALESMLILAGNQPRLLLEIGALYERLGAPKTAQYYFKQARKYAAEGSEDAAHAGRFLNTAKKRSSDHIIHGFARFGLRYQSNPALAPEVEEILSGGNLIPRPENRRPEEDWNAFLVSRVAHRYRIKPRISWTSDVVVYGTVYQEQDRLDYGMVHLTTGPEYSSPNNAGGQYSLRPYVLYRATRVDEHAYEHAPGGGLDFKLRTDPNQRWQAIYEYRDPSYQRPGGSAERLNGSRNSLDLRYRLEFLPGQALSARLYGQSDDAQEERFEVDQLQVGLRYSHKFANTLFKGTPRMTLSPYARFTWKEYGAADAGIDPNTRRQDEIWRLGVNFTLPFTSSWALFFNYEHSEIDSNIVNFDAKNDQFMIGLQTGF